MSRPNWNGGNYGGREKAGRGFNPCPGTMKKDSYQNGHNSRTTQARRPVLDSYERSKRALTEGPACDRFWTEIHGAKATSPPDDCTGQGRTIGLEKGSSRNKIREI